MKRHAECIRTYVFMKKKEKTRWVDKYSCWLHEKWPAHQRKKARKLIWITCYAIFTYLFIYLSQLFQLISMNTWTDTHTCLEYVCSSLLTIFVKESAKKCSHSLKITDTCTPNEINLINFIWKIQLIDLMIWWCAKNYAGAQLYVLMHLYIANNVDKAQVDAMRFMRSCWAYSQFLKCKQKKIALRSAESSVWVLSRWMSGNSEKISREYNCASISAYHVITFNLVVISVALILVSSFLLSSCRRKFHVFNC